VEFLVQTFQLLRGGRKTQLQTTSLLTALSALKELSILPDDAVRTLNQSYEFLRRLENAIQALHDQQTHSLPQGEDLARLSRVMGFNDPAELLGELESTRNSVFTQIESSFPERTTVSGQEKAVESWLAIKAENWGSDDPLAPLWKKFTLSLSRLSLSNRAAQRLDRFMPGLLPRLNSPGVTLAVAEDVLNLVLAICRRSAYMSLLVQNPSALERMLSLFIESDWVAKSVIRYPELLDELIDPALGKLLPDEAEIRRNARRILDTNQDTEAALVALNHLKLAFSLRIAVAELETTISTRMAQVHLSNLAETIINSCYELAKRDVCKKHGILPGDGIGIISYGSLGARELSYGSDLDLIFLYRRSSTPSDGKRPLEPERYHTAIVRRLLSFLTSSTPSGKLYEVDTRLRPNGRSGLLVSSLSAFENYQLKEAWTWEIQALCRARACAGNRAIGEEFEEIRKAILRLKREPNEVKSDLQKMRRRLREAFPDGDPLKHREGGLIDIDFVAQLGTIINGGSCEACLDHTGTHEQLHALRDSGWLENEPFNVLDQAQKELSR
jgi:glutamate-ammonia-ligase adenylyltransferase